MFLQTHRYDSLSVPLQPQLFLILNLFKKAKSYKIYDMLHGVNVNL